MDMDSWGKRSLSLYGVHLHVLLVIRSMYAVLFLRLEAFLV